MRCMDYSMINFLKTIGFEEVEPWVEYKHKNGLIVFLSEHRWSIEHEDGQWLEEGVLDETDDLEKIIEEHGINIKEMYKQKHIKRYKELYGGDKNVK